MQTMQWFLDRYGESHKNPTNKMIHWICVPAIMFSLFGLIMAIPFLAEKTLMLNWAAVVMLLAILFYLRLSIPMFLGFVLIGGVIIWGNYAILRAVNFDAGQLALISLLIFAGAWVGQFVGHKIEGKKPSFLDDLKFLLIGPAWLLHFIYKRLGIRY
jgi:uncharacterized membrane protein YGL010W